MKIAVMALAAALAAAGLGCEGDDGDAKASGAAGSQDQPAVGATVYVQFRRDYLGATGTPIGPLGEGAPNGVPVAVGGELRRLTPEWVVVESGGREIWVPRSAVLLLEVKP